MPSSEKAEIVKSEALASDFSYSAFNLFLYNLLTNGTKSDRIHKRLFAGVAQLVEQLIRNQQVTGSSPVTSSKRKALLAKCFCYFYWSFYGFM